ncbi:MAG: rhomboid family intramembrane serine protease [Pseudomonadales bacterium]|nr:rhomboid family intramembrane serine protease [Pseudomonadales bacterium]
MNPVYFADTRRAVMDAALVMAAREVEYVVEQTGNGWALLVAEEDLARASSELHTYWRENAPPSITPRDVEIVDSGWFGVLGYLAIIWSIPAIQSWTNFDLSDAGHLHAEAVRSGEIWRVITALTLHGDLGHIFSNSLFGALFGLFVGRHLGSGLGWLLVLGCGAIANFTNAWIQPDAFRAVGASTVTFAALGLVPAFAWRRGYFRGNGLKRGFAPIFAAICILSYTGFGSERVDVGGHVFGFTYGIIAGLLFAEINLKARSRGDQQRAGIMALIVVSTAWLVAL